MSIGFLITEYFTKYIFKEKYKTNTDMEVLDYE